MTVQNGEQRSGVIISPSYKRTLHFYTKKLKVLVISSLFRRLGITITMLNILVLATNHYPMEEKFGYWTEVINFIFLVYFAIEAGAKILGLGFKRFWM